MPDNHHPTSTQGFDRLFARLRQHRRLREVLRGLLLALAVGALCSLAVVLWMSVSHFEQASVDIGRYAVYASLGLLFATLVVWPALKRVDDMQCALQTERQTPQLDGLLLSAVAMRRRGAGAGASNDTSAELADEVLRRTVHAGEKSYVLPTRIIAPACASPGSCLSCS